MSDLIQLAERPTLHDPFLVMHLTGWTDAGMAGEASAVFLRARWNARRLARFDADKLLDFRARRPVVRIADGTIESVTWSHIDVSLCDTGGPRDALLLTGPEPDFRWGAFTDAVSWLCQELGVTEVFGLGGFPAPSLHTDPVAILGTSADPKLARRLDTVPAVVELSAGMQSVLEDRLHQDGIPTTGIWARVPPYLAGGSHPPAALALIRTLVLLTGVHVDTTELEAAAKLPCAEAIAEEDLPTPGRPDRVDVFGTMAEVRYQGETLFLTRFADEWLLHAAGCTPQQPKPYDCALHGG